MDGFKWNSSALTAVRSGSISEHVDGFKWNSSALTAVRSGSISEHVDGFKWNSSALTAVRSGSISEHVDGFKWNSSALTAVRSGSISEHVDGFKWNSSALTAVRSGSISEHVDGFKWNSSALIAVRSGPITQFFSIQVSTFRRSLLYQRHSFRSQFSCSCKMPPGFINKYTCHKMPKYPCGKTHVIKATIGDTLVFQLTISMSKFPLGNWGSKNTADTDFTYKINACLWNKRVPVKPSNKLWTL